MYDQVIADLRTYYDHTAEERDNHPIAPWKVQERGRFLEMLLAEGKSTLLEIGSGPGRDGTFFQEQGLNLVCTDLSPEMVKRCRDKGLTAYAMDFLSLNFPASAFDAVYSLNSLLHVPKADLETVLDRVHSLLKPQGLFYLGVYGGVDREGLWPEDASQPQRFFSYHTDEAIKGVVTSYFGLVYFRSIPLGDQPRDHFQSMILRKE